MTQHHRLIQMFEEKKVISNYELRSMTPAMFQFPARILELKAKGYHKEGKFDETDHQKYWYTYTPSLNRLAKSQVADKSPKEPASTFGAQAVLFNFSQDQHGNLLAG